MTSELYPVIGGGTRGPAGRPPHGRPPYRKSPLQKPIQTTLH